MADQGINQVHESERVESTRAGIIWAMCLSGVGITLASFFLIRSAERRSLEAGFRSVSQDRVTAIRSSIGAKLTVLASMRAMYLASGGVINQNFSEVFKPFREETRGIRALEWIPRISDVDRDAFESSVKARGFPEFQITERESQGVMVRAARRQEYYPVLEIEPYEGNEIAHGYDLGSDPARESALIAATNSGLPAVSERVVLVQGSEEYYAVLVFLPVYAGGSVPDDALGRRERLIGFVLGVLELRELVESAFGDFQSEAVDVTVADISAAAGTQFLYSHRSHPNSDSSARGSSLEQGSAHSLGHETVLQVGNRDWLVRCTPAPEFIAKNARQGSWAVLVVGIGLTLAAAGVTTRASRRERRITSLVRAGVDANLEMRRVSSELLAERVGREGDVERTHHILDSVRTFVGLLAPDGTLLAMNRAPLEVAAVELDDAIGKPLWETPAWNYSPSVQKLLREQIAKAAGGEHVRFEAAVILGGELRIIDSDISPLVDSEGRVVELVGTAMDVTGRKRAEDEARLWSQVVDNMVAGVAIIKAEDGVFQVVNNAYERIFGYEHGELLGRHVSILNAAGEGRPVEVAKEVIEALKKHGSWRGEILNRRKDGAPFWAYSNVTTFDHHEYGTVWVEVKEDITERKESEKALAEHREQLEELVLRRTEQLEAAQADLVRSERLATIGRLLAIVSHELRNPLGTIRNAIYTLRHVIEGEGARGGDALDRADRSIDRCVAIVDELLDYGKEKTLRLELIDIDYWLGEVLDEIDIPESIELARKLDSGVEMEFDREKLRRCVINLVQNAVHAIELVGGADDGAGRLSIATRMGGENIEVLFTDSGPGILVKDQAAALEPLVSTKSFGVGLGLPIVRQIMRSHGGDIEFVDDALEGFTVKIWMPLESAAREREDASLFGGVPSEGE